MDASYTAQVRNAQSLGRVLQQARMANGLSQRDLAARLGTTQAYIWQLESGHATKAIERVFAAMDEVGMSLTADIVVTDHESAAVRYPQAEP